MEFQSFLKVIFSSMNNASQTLSSARRISSFHLLNIKARTEIDTRMFVLLRCLLAFSALAIVATLSESGPLLRLAYGTLSIYCIFSVIIALVWYQRDWPVMPRLFHWIDVLFYAYLIALSGSTENYFFLFFFYPILVSSFSWGFREGVLVTLVSTILFATVGLIEGQISALIPAFGLLLFGYVISYLGVYEHLHRNRLALLKEINNPWHPRFGIDHVNNVNLERLLNFYNANTCVLIMRRRTMQKYVMYTATHGKTARSDTQRDVSGTVGEALSRLPDTLGAYYHDPEGPWWMRYRGYSAYDFDLTAKTDSFQQDCAVWINLLDTKAFVTVPFAHEGTSGRIFIATSNGWFTHADIGFLAQASDAMATVVENMHLVEELIVGAAESERLLMSRDLHDTTIQPYIGLKLALDGLYREAGDGNPLAPRIRDLIEMTESTIHDLRNYAATLKDNSPMPGEFLIDAMARQAERLRRFYGIEVEIKSEISTKLKDRLAAEVFQIISESLSNVLRHTAAKKAFVSIVCENSKLLLKVGNEVSAEAGGVVEFMPRSISERVRAMGGETTVEHGNKGFTVVSVSIPM